MLKKILFLVMLLSMQTLFADLSFEQELDNVSFNEVAKEASISASRQGKKSFKFTGTYIETGRSFLEVEYKNGKEKEYYVSGRVQNEGNYINNQLEGKYIIYYPNGRIYMKSNFINNKHNGEIVYYYENGKTMLKGNTKDGISIGEFEFYDENGKLEYKGEYDSIKDKFMPKLEKYRNKTVRSN